MNHFGYVILNPVSIFILFNSYQQLNDKLLPINIIMYWCIDNIQVSQELGYIADFEVVRACLEKRRNDGQRWRGERMTNMKTMKNEDRIPWLGTIWNNSFITWEKIKADAAAKGRNKPVQDEVCEA